MASFALFVCLVGVDVMHCFFKVYGLWRAMGKGKASASLDVRQDLITFGITNCDIYCLFF